MSDPLSILRDYFIRKEQIRHDDQNIIIGDLKFPRNTLTAYKQVFEPPSMAACNECLKECSHVWTDVIFDRIVVVVICILWRHFTSCSHTLTLLAPPKRALTTRRPMHKTFLAFLSWTKRMSSTISLARQIPLNLSFPLESLHPSLKSGQRRRAGSPQKRTGGFFSHFSCFHFESALSLASRSGGMIYDDL
jgi:hypothetical protein